MVLYIYTLDCPTTGLVKYVGKTNNPKNRLRQHIGSKEFNKKSQWIKSLVKKGLYPKMSVVDEFSSEEECNYWEAWYIQYFKYLGFTLKNDKGGGEGGFLSDETKIKIGNANRGKTRTPEWKAKSVKNLRAGQNKGVPMSEKQRKQLFDGLHKYRLENKDKNCNSKIDRATAELIKLDIINKVKRITILSQYNITKHIYYDIKRGKTWKS